MKRLFLYSAALVAALLAGASARASQIAWTYDWTAVGSDGVHPIVSAGTGGINFTNELTTPAKGSSDIVATNIRVFSSASSTSPDVISNGAYKLFLTITDTASGVQSNPIEFDGTLSGSFSVYDSHVANTFASTTPMQVVLGGNTYTVTIGPYSPPGPMTAKNAGSIGAHVNVQGPHITGNSPEPSSLVLAGLGLSLFGGRWLRRRRLALRLA